MKTKKKEKKTYASTYYEKNRKKILKRANEWYWNKKKKTGKCKMCGKKLPKELTALTKYCDDCLYSKGHGPDAHRMAAARWWRKKHLTNKKRKSKI